MRSLTGPLELRRVICCELRLSNRELAAQEGA